MAKPKSEPRKVSGSMRTSTKVRSVPDEHVDEVTQPTPVDAVAQLMRVLASIPPWERFPSDLTKWTTTQIAARAKPMQGNLLIADRANGSFEIEKPARHRERMVAEWEQRTGRKPTRDLPRIRRSPIDERRDLVAAMRTGFEVFLPPAIVAVLAAGGRAEPLRELERDDELHADTVSAAVTELRFAVPASKKVDSLTQAGSKTKTPIDVVHDAVCVAIRKALSGEANGLILKKLVGRCGGSQKETTIKTRLRLLKDGGDVMQTGNRGPYRLTEAGIERQRNE
jgi:hypothetical protein